MNLGGPIAKTAGFVLLCFFSGCSRESLPQLSFRVDLRDHTLRIHRDVSLFGAYNQLALLSDKLLLVAINQRTIYRSVEPADVDISPSTVLLFNLEAGTLQASVQLPIEKVSDSLQPLPNGRFLIKNESGIQVCNDHLSCE